ncbi:MAG: LamG domain-containing protein [Candidatus Omnitrophica bacterium]|nr:LamG domain-containing protein [Candidatus Omnitrophota bacterium]
MIKKILISILLIQILSISQNKFSWEEKNSEINNELDIKWKPQPFLFKKGESVRYIDYENGNDNNDGLTKNTPWKHHPWDEKAEGKAKECKGIHTFIFKKGVIYRGRLFAKESGTETNPIRLTVDPSWGIGDACIYGSIKIEGGWRKCNENINLPEADKIWCRELNVNFIPRAAWMIEREIIERIPIAREPDWEEDEEDVLRNWWEWKNVSVKQEGGKIITGFDPINLNSPDPNFYKDAIIWFQGGSVIGTPFPSKIIEYNPNNKSVTFTGTWFTPPMRGNKYFFENKLNFLDSPNEYYYDEKKKIIYIRLPKDDNPNEKIIELAKDFSSIEIINQSNIEISGLTFRFINTNNPLYRGIDGDVFLAAIRIIGKCKNIKVKNCKFEHLPKAIRVHAKEAGDIIDKIEITDNEIYHADHGGIEIADGQNWGQTQPPFGKVKQVKILRNNFYDIGKRPIRGSPPFTISIQSADIVEISGNILEKNYGGGINVFGGKHHDLRDCPLIKIFIYHNKVKDCLLHTNDYGGIEVWQGGPAFVYNNIVINPVGPWHGNYLWAKEAKREVNYGTANFGFAYYADGQYKGYFFNNIAIGKNNQLGSPLCNACAYMEVGGFNHAFFNNLAYKFGCAFRKQPSLNGVQRAWYLGNYLADISDIIFDHYAYGTSENPDYYETIAYYNNIIASKPRKIGVFDREQKIFLDIKEFSENLKTKKSLRYEVGETKGVMLKLEDVLKEYINNINIKFFVPYPLYKVVGEWNFYKNKYDSSFIFGENFYYSDEYIDRVMYHYVPWNNLKGINLNEDNYKNGILENWIEGALEFDGEKIYCVLPDSEIKKDYSFTYTGIFKYGDIVKGSQVVYPGSKRQTVDMDRNSFLIELVLKAEKENGGIVEKMKEGKGYSVYLKNGKVNFKIGYGDKNYLVYTEKRIDDKRWHHLIVELDMIEKIGRIYIDGKEEKVIREGKIEEGSLSNTGDFLVGRSIDTGYFKGLIDFLRVSRGSLKDAETTIEEIYKWEFDGPFLRDFLGNKIF